MLWMLWVRVVSVAFLFLLYSLLSFRSLIRMGDSYWSLQLGRLWAVDRQGGADVYCGFGAPSGLRFLPWDGGSGGWDRCWDMLRYALGI